MSNAKLCVAALVWFAFAHTAHAACCYFSAKNTDILQPAQKVFITWDPAEKQETFTVQPKFEGNALDFGMVIPTPAVPKLHEMPREFFKHLAVYSILKKREHPQSQLLPSPRLEVTYALQSSTVVRRTGAGIEKKSTVVVLQSGVVGSLDYKTIVADWADDLYQWLKDHKYNYSGDEATLNHYIQKKWFFTVMKIDTAQMKRNKDGSYAGEVTPTRFAFPSDKLVYPLKITQILVKDKTEALFYVQAPHKVDLPGDMTYQYTWVPMLQSAMGCTPDGLPGKGVHWLKAIDGNIPVLLARAKELGFNFVSGQRPQPNQKGHIPTTMEWARKLTADDIKVLKGEGPYGEKVPNVDEGFSKADLKDPARAEAIYKVIRARLEKARMERPFGYLVREAPADDVRDLRFLAGHLQAGLFITKFRKIFARDEMNDDLLLVPARHNGQDDISEYEEILPTSPP
ncbi:MAG: DUF2330 domain-containing protein [Gemmataceae bacterium]|nr:DUF2330 domain-containing protein [Gemmataceae bacterium]MCI0739456.1 DUF2330 domain-containing protein [Gemmataceae bacterium]